MILPLHRRKIADTPCAHCGHAHAGGTSSHLAREGLHRCGEWMSSWTWERAEFWACPCPEWIAPPFRCVCGAWDLNEPFPLWLNGERACSMECAVYRGRKSA